MLRMATTTKTAVVLRKAPCGHCAGTGSEIDNAGTGKILMGMRSAAKATQTDIAELMKISSTYVSDLELGRRNWTSELITGYLAALAKHQAASGPKHPS